MNDYESHQNRNGHRNFRLETLIVNFNLSDFLTKKQLTLIKDLKMQVIVETKHEKFKIAQPINIKIKNFNESSKKMKAILFQ